MPDANRHSPSTMNPLVSILTPCYRQGRFLRATIQSVLAQMYSPIEMIIVNDGSDDDTEAVAQSFGNRIKYHWQPNSGVPASPRNAGLSLASGKYILCLDADDLLHPQAVKWLVDAASNRDDVLCVMGVRKFKTDPSLDGWDWAAPFGDGPPECRLMSTCFGTPNAFLCSRSMLTSIGGFDTDIKLKGCEDWDVWLRLVFAGAKVVRVSQVGALYREYPTSLSKNVVLMTLSEAEVFWRARRWAAANPARMVAMGGDPRAYRSYVARELSHRAFTLRDRGRYSAALRLYWRSLRCGGVGAAAIAGMAKLLPHWLMRRLSPPSSVVRQ